MKSKVLSCEKELKEFQNLYWSYSENPIKLSYLKQCHVRAFFIEGQMSAGYALNSGDEKRYLQMIPSRGVTKDIQEEIISESTEVTCMWVSRNYSSVPARAFFYFIYTMDVAKSSKRHIMAGSFEERIKKLHSVPFSEMIYDGQSWFHGTGKKLWVYREFRNRHCLKVLLFILYLVITLSLKSMFRNTAYDNKRITGEV